MKDVINLNYCSELQIIRFSLFNREAKQIVWTAEGTESALSIPILTTIWTVCTSTDKTFSYLYQEYRILGVWKALVHVLKLNSQSSNGTIQSFLNKIYRSQIDFFILNKLIKWNSSETILLRGSWFLSSLFSLNYLSWVRSACCTFEI